MDIIFVIMCFILLGLLIYLLAAHRAHRIIIERQQERIIELNEASNALARVAIMQAWNREPHIIDDE